MQEALWPHKTIKNTIKKRRLPALGRKQPNGQEPKPDEYAQIDSGGCTKGVIQMNARYAANTNANKMGSALAG